MPSRPEITTLLMRREQVSARWPVLVLLLFVVATPGRAADPVPDAPQVALRDLHAVTRVGRKGKAVADKGLPADRFVVVGRACETVGSEAPSNWLLVDSLMACCTVVRIGLPLHGGQNLQHNDWIAVYGRLIRTGPEWTVPRLDTDLGLVSLGGDDWGIQVERITPARDVMFKDNVVDLLNGLHFSRFRRAVEQGGVTDALKLAEDITILAPHDLAFDNPNTGFQPESLTSPELRHFVLGHVIEGSVTTKTMMHQTQVTMMNGDRHRLTWQNGRVYIGTTRILMANLSGHNGIVHMVMPMLPVSEPKPVPRFFSATGEEQEYSHDPLFLPWEVEPLD